MTASLVGRTRGTRGGPLGTLRALLLVLVFVAVQFVAAMAAAASKPMVAVGAMAVAVGLAMCVLWPAGLLAVAFAAVFFSWRVGPASADMSLTDAVAMLAAVAALPYVPWRSRHFRRVLLAMVAYCLVASISVVANFNQGAAIGVAHRFEFVMGAVCIGAAAARLGRTTMVVRALTVVGVVMSAAAIVDTFTNSFRAAYPFGLQKNGYATLAASCFLVVLLAGRHLRWPRGVTFLAGALLLCGIAASQSRGVGLALVGVLAIYGIRTAWQGQARKVAKLLPLFLLVAVVIGAIAVVTFTGTQAKTTADSEKYTAVGSRVDTYEVAWDYAIRPHLLTGKGPGWFTLPGAPGGEPHDIFIQELSEVGILGLVALLWLLWRTLQTTNRIGGDLGRAAWYVLVARVLASTVDIFWVAGPLTLPFMVVGLAVGAGALDVPPARQRRVLQGV